MRIIGQYKGSDIKITDLHMSETYGELLLAPSEKMYEAVNWEMINVGIPKRVEKMWGKDKRLHVMETDYKGKLPGVEVIVRLDCGAGKKEGDCSDLILAWFQEPDEDPFAQAVSNLKKISWEEMVSPHLADDFKTCSK